MLYRSRKYAVPQGIQSNTATAALSVQESVTGLCRDGKEIAISLSCSESRSRTSYSRRAGEMIQRWRGLGLRGPRGKGSLSASKGPKPPIQLLQLLKNSPREVKRDHFRYILGPPVPPRRWNYWGPEGKVPPGPPRFSSHVLTPSLCQGSRDGS